MELKPGYKQTEVGVIPEDWDVSTVGREFEIKLGKMLDAERNTGVPKPYLGNKAIQWGRIDFNDLPTVPMTRADIESYRLREGDLLVCEGGEVGRAAIWHGPIDECYYQKAIHRLRALHGFEPSLMVGLLRRWADSGRLANYVTKTSIAHLPREKFLVITMPVPPQAEQRLISQVLCDLDALVAQLDGLIAKKRNIKQAAMQELLTGKRRLPGFEGEWVEVVLGEHAKFFKGKGLPKSDLTPYGEYGCVHYGELFTLYNESIRETRSYTHKVDNLFFSAANDVLMPTSDVTPRGLAKASCICRNGIVIGGDILVIRPNPGAINGTFLSYLIRRDSAQILRLVTGSTVYHIYSGDMKRFAFHLPTVIEQEAIVELLDDLGAELESLEVSLGKAQAIMQGMMQQLLTGKIRLR
jgi:type I restriction enzyme S subunit